MTPAVRQIVGIGGLRMAPLETHSLLPTIARIVEDRERCGVAGVRTLERLTGPRPP